MGKSSINGPFSMAMLNNQRVFKKKTSFGQARNQGCDFARLSWRRSLASSFSFMDKTTAILPSGYD